MKNSILVQNFIEQIWNQQAFDMLDHFLHPDFKDHSLLPTISPDKEGVVKWITATGISFTHNTTIENQVTEGDQSMIRIKMKLKHIGVWRGIEPTSVEMEAIGYRYFKIKDDRIIEHWGLIDGQFIENQLKESSHGCKVAE